MGLSSYKGTALHIFETSNEFPPKEINPYHYHNQKTLREEVERGLENLVSKYSIAVKLADYWICKARIAAQDDDVQRVVCMLEQAHAFQAQVKWWGT